MKRNRHIPEQIIRKLLTAEQLLNRGMSVANVCRTSEVSAPTLEWIACTRCFVCSCETPAL
jgi:hypothetical protein